MPSEDLSVEASNNMVRDPSNPRVFLEMSVDCKTAGRLVIELFSDLVPKTAENFRALCTGEKGRGDFGTRLHLRGTPIHRIIPGFMCQGGDVMRGNGSGGHSIYGQYFPDESFKAEFTAPGMLGMVNFGKDRNHSQFFITYKDAPWLNGSNVAFGHVIEGMDVLYSLEAEGSSGGRTTREVLISDCGQVTKLTEDSDGDSGVLESGDE